MPHHHDNLLRIMFAEEYRINLAGSLELTTAPDLHAAVECLHAKGSEPVVIDLSGVTFCDSSGLSTLLWARNNRAALVNPSTRLRRLLEITGLADNLLSAHRPGVGARQ